MIKPLELMIGLRYTRAKRRNHFISFISMTSMVGIVLGVWALITVTTQGAPSRRLIYGFGLVAACVLPVLAWADVGPPAHLRVSEREDGVYAVQWRVPKVLPPRAAPVPVLPEGCEPVGEVSVTDQPAAWLLAQESALVHAAVVLVLVLVLEWAAVC